MTLYVHKTRNRKEGGVIMRYINTVTEEEQWKMAERRVTMLWRDGKTNGAKKEGKYGMISEIAKRPEDGRKTAGVKFQNAVT